MKYPNYLNIDITNFQNNIKNFKKKYKYKYYILDVSNNTFGLGSNIIKYLKDIDYLYVNNLNDIYMIRKINKDIPIIFEGLLSEDNILDLINHNIILTINNLDILKILEKEDLFANLKIILNIDLTSFNGFNNKSEIKIALETLKNIDKVEIFGIKYEPLKNDNLLEVNTLINDLLLKNIKLFILNNENFKSPFKNSNAIKLDYSIYGINQSKPTIFKKIESEYIQIFSIHSTINKITKTLKHKKTKYIASIPFGYKNGMTEYIKKVVINDNYYNIINITDLYTLIEINESVNINDTVEITGPNNPLENYISLNNLSYLHLLNRNLPIIFNNENRYVY